MISEKDSVNILSKVVGFLLLLPFPPVVKPARLFSPAMVIFNDTHILINVLKITKAGQNSQVGFANGFLVQGS